jgi:hypothetical protein
MELNNVGERLLLTAVRAIVGDDGVIARDTELRVYECDGYTPERAMPPLVALPRSTYEVSVSRGGDVSRPALAATHQLRPGHVSESTQIR